MESVGCVKGEAPAEFFLVYSRTDGASPWWARWADHELAHVEIWQPVGDGCYIAVMPMFDCLSIELMGREPTGIVQRVWARRPLGYAMFPMGVRTCVTVAKAMLGIRSIWIQTPRQLHNFIRRRNGQVG